VDPEKVHPLYISPGNRVLKENATLARWSKEAVAFLKYISEPYNRKEISLVCCQTVQKSIQVALDPCFENNDMGFTPHFCSMESVTISLSRL
jgi:hypothetical protein